MPFASLAKFAEIMPHVPTPLDPARDGSGQNHPPPQEAGSEWCLRANCALTPSQLAGLMGASAALSLSISLGFWWVGASLIWPFACVETLCLVVAFVMYARHTQDEERILLRDGMLVLRRCRAGRAQVDQWPASLVSLACGPRTGHLIEIRSGGRCIRVGQGLAASQRVTVAQSLSTALRQWNRF